MYWWKFSCYKTYIVIKVREVKIVKEVKNSDGLWRFACGDVCEMYSTSVSSKLCEFSRFQMHCRSQFLPFSYSNCWQTNCNLVISIICTPVRMARSFVQNHNRKMFYLFATSLTFPKFHISEKGFVLYVRHWTPKKLFYILMSHDKLAQVILDHLFWEGHQRYGQAALSHPFLHRRK